VSRFFGFIWSPPILDRFATSWLWWLDKHLNVDSRLSGAADLPFSFEIAPGRDYNGRLSRHGAQEDALPVAGAHSELMLISGPLSRGLLIPELLS
jgi:hypothetical protein